ncbi:phosphatidylinositol 3,4,5-trisphosphate 3-phosphatase and dual-specificity protein phosphatase PTEN-like isoform X1 [Schistocerca gregaria]|uniref:phosphatidylinositol 3,4,5-trisphosphate 3-phosphatase and dual-specificity protein phosphatase PTEN-like isoform X1 n=1 Tax=Schistocerca gregaria TaxID=7010 RepID=UPI00211DEA89|nr:phosphatidylinositol 3,4,5-trisphosphate 3-phosphatase and dual-specificity protein phosphatase PTEN-like isoform X1 [Schistocerca gregaria]
MLGFVREKVSKNKLRFKDTDAKIDLDLTYITPRIIAMGFPSSDVEGLYRNPINEVYRFFELRHKDKYKLYNLCAERDYDHIKFHGRVSRYPFQDHNAPPVDTIVECCKDIKDWLEQDEENVVAINCKAGKGRTGLIICCYLLYAGIVSTSDEAIEYYGARRTKDGKGVTIASQKRYIRYYEQALKYHGGVPPSPNLLRLLRIKVNTVPNFSNEYSVIVISKNRKLITTPFVSVPKKATEFSVDINFPIYGDVKIQLQTKRGRSYQKVCYIWFSTAFEDPHHLVFKKDEIDLANKDKKHIHFKKEFSIELFFELLIKGEDLKTDAEKEASSKYYDVVSPYEVRNMKDIDANMTEEYYIDPCLSSKEMLVVGRCRVGSFYDVTSDDENECFIDSSRQSLQYEDPKRVMRTIEPPLRNKELTLARKSTSQHAEPTRDPETWSPGIIRPRSSVYVRPEKKHTESETMRLGSHHYSYSADFRPKSLNRWRSSVPKEISSQRSSQEKDSGLPKRNYKIETKRLVDVVKSPEEEENSSEKASEEKV